MPIAVNTELVKLSQAEFAEVAYAVMKEVFALHSELGRLFDEKVYQNALATRMSNVQSEVEIVVSFLDFRRSYFMDVLASAGAVFELKAVECLNVSHRSQLLNYLLLSGLQHGKLVNLRSEKVEHEFVNTSLSNTDRINFEINDMGWHATDGFGVAEKSRVEDMLKDWGTCLARSLYEEAVVHFSGGAEKVFTEVDVSLGNGPVAKQVVPLCAERTAFKITTFENGMDGNRKEISRFLNRMELDTIQWINISRNQLTFETLM